MSEMFAGARMEEGVELLPETKRVLRRLSYHALGHAVTEALGTGFRAEVEADVVGFWSAVEDAVRRVKPKGWPKEVYQQVTQFAAHARRPEVEVRVAAQHQTPNAGPQRSFEVYTWTSGVLRVRDWPMSTSEDGGATPWRVEIGAQPYSHDVRSSMGVRVVGAQDLHVDTRHVLRLLDRTASEYDYLQAYRSVPPKEFQCGFRPQADADILGAMWGVRDAMEVPDGIAQKWRPDVRAQVWEIVDAAIDLVDPRIHNGAEDQDQQVCRALSVRDWLAARLKAIPEDAWFATYSPASLAKFPILGKAQPLGLDEAPPTFFGHVVADEVANNPLALTLLRRMYALATEDEAIHGDDSLELDEGDDECQSGFWNAVALWCDKVLYRTSPSVPPQLVDAVRLVRDNVPETTVYEWDDEQMAGAGPMSIRARFGKDKPFHWPAQTCVAVEVTLRVYVAADHCTKTTHKAAAAALAKAVADAGLDVTQNWDDDGEGDVFTVETIVPGTAAGHPEGRRVDIVGVSTQERNIRARVLAFGDPSDERDEARVSAVVGQIASKRSRARG